MNALFIISLSPVNNSTCLNQERNNQAKKIQNNSEENVLVDFDVRGQRGIDFSLKEVLLWIIMDVDFS